MKQMQEVYISFNKEELARLCGLTFEALGLYFHLKEKANFKTGVVGKFFNQKLRYATFAKMMGRPASQGREERRFDTTDIKRLLAQLESVGLVEEHDWDGTRLTMRLPFSPLWKNNPELPNGKPKLPYGSQEKTSQSPAQQGIGDGGVSVSVLTSERGSIPFFSSEITTECGGDFAADPLEGRTAPPAASGPAKGANAAGKLAASLLKRLREAGVQQVESAECRIACDRWAVSGVSLKTLNDVIEMNRVFMDDNSPLTFHEIAVAMPVTEKRQGEPASKTDCYRASLRAAGGIYLDTAVSREIFEAWDKAGVSADAVEAAIAERKRNDSSPMKPGDLTQYLFPKPETERDRARREQRGRVVL